MLIDSFINIRINMTVDNFPDSERQLLFLKKRKLFNEKCNKLQIMTTYFWDECLKAFNYY